MITKTTAMTQNGRILVADLRLAHFSTIVSGRYLPGPITADFERVLDGISFYWINFWPGNQILPIWTVRCRLMYTLKYVDIRQRIH
jgi:hypothetical protein